MCSACGPQFSIRVTRAKSQGASLRSSAMTTTLENGLVDELGGFDRALEVAAEQAGLGEDEHFSVVWLPRAPTVVEMFLDEGPTTLLTRAAALAARREVAAQLPRALREALPDAALLSCLENEGVVALMPFRVHAR